MAKKRAKRRGNREGTIFQRANGQWVVSLTVENLDGSKSRKSRNAKSQAHGRMVLDELRQECRIREKSAGKATVSELAEKWFSSLKGDHTTKEGYRRVIDKRITPLIGSRKCDDCSVDIIEKWCEEIKSTGYNRKTKEFDAPLGERSQQVAFVVLSAIFGYGCRRKLVAFNPCEAEIKPVPEEPEIHPFTDDEVRRILAHVKGHRLEALHHLSFAIGPRQGELFGLQWRDVDWGNSTIRIERQARDHAGYVTIKAPKTKGSKRTVSIPSSVLAQLHQRRLFAIKEQRAKPSDFVFTSQNGQVIRRTNFGRRHWKSLLKKLKIEHRGHHHVRHTAATTMLREGTAIHIVAYILGHANPATTHRVYSHYIPSDGKLAAEKMQIALSRLTS